MAPLYSIDRRFFRDFSGYGDLLELSSGTASRPVHENARILPSIEWQFIDPFWQFD